MVRFFYAVKVVSKTQGALDAGALELAAPGYDDLTETDGTAAAMAEVRAYPDSGMVQFRGVVLPREDWGGLLVTLQAKSAGEA